MLKEEQIQLDKYVDRIIKKIRQGKHSPFDVLKDLLREYLEEHTAHSFALPMMDDNRFDLRFSRVSIKLLQSSHYEKSQITVLALHLNTFYDEIFFNKTLTFLFGAFFSVYEYYRIHLSEKVLKKLFYKNVWDDYLQRQINAVLWIIQEDPCYDERNKVFRAASCEALGRFSSWIPKNMRNNIVNSLIRYMADSYYKIRCIESIVLLKQWIPEERRAYLIEKLFENIIIQDETNRSELRLESCRAIMQLRDWPRSARCDENIDRLISQLNSTDPNIVREACSVFGRIGDIVPSKYYPKILKYLLTHSNQGSHETAIHATKVLGKIPHQILIPFKAVLLDKLQAYLISEDPRQCQAACELFSQIWSLFSLDQATELIITLRSLLKSFVPASLKVTVIQVFESLNNKIPTEIRKSIIHDLLLTINREDEDNHVKITAVVALGCLENFIPVESRLMVVMTILNVLNDTKSSEKLKEVTYETIEHLHIASQAIRDDLAKNLYQKIDQELAKVSTTTFRFVTPLVFWPKGKLTDALGENNSHYNFDHLYITIVKTRDLFNSDQRKKIAGKLLHQLKNNIFEDKGIRSFYCAIAAYAEDMNIEQKVLVLGYLLPSTFYEGCCHHHAKVLFVEIYASYRQELIRLMLKRIPIQQHDYLSEDVMNQVMSYTRSVSVLGV